jgi:hypothetical protein
LVGYRSGQHLTEIVGLLHQQQAHIPQPYFYLILATDTGLCPTKVMVSSTSVITTL